MSAFVIDNKEFNAPKIFETLQMFLSGAGAGLCVSVSSVSVVSDIVTFRHILHPVFCFHFPPPAVTSTFATQKCRIFAIFCHKNAGESDTKYPNYTSVGH